MDNLPREIILNILSRLPATSLVQMKSVCWAFRNVLRDQQLVNLHFSNASMKDPCLILHSDCPIRNQLRFVEISSSGCPGNDHGGGVMMKKIYVPAMAEFDVVCSCNGLLCISNLLDNTAHVFNPFTGDYVELPEPDHSSDHEVVFGFGFHHRKKEYKVVRIVYYTNAASNIRCRAAAAAAARLPESEVQIFTLGSSSSSSWRRLGEVTFHIRTPKQVYLHGKLHWVSWYNRFSLFPILISFDLEDEKFRMVPKPGCCGRNSCGYQLVVLGECLSAAAFCNNGNLEIWVMKEYGVEESWTRRYRIGDNYMPRGLEQEVDPSFKISKLYLNTGFVRVLGLLKNGEILLEYECRALVCYEPNRGTFRDLVIRGMPELFETFVHVGGINWIDSVIEI